MLDRASQAQTFLSKGILQSLNELAAEDDLEHIPGQEESVGPLYPARAAGREPTGGNNAMNVGMKQQVLPPGMQNAEEADLRASAPRCFGFAATWVRVSETARNNKLYSSTSFCRMRSVNSCGRLNTTWK